MNGRPRVAVIHAITGSMQPASDAFADAFPEADVWHLVDDRLMSDATAEGVTTPLAARMTALIDYAVTHGAQGVLIACSLYGDAAAAARPVYDVPILTSDQALFDEVVRLRPDKVVLVAAQPAAAEDSTRRLEADLRAAGRHPVILSHVIDRDGRSIPDAAVAVARADADGADVIVLANFSLTGARDTVERELGRTTLTPAHLAARVFRARLLDED